MPKWQSYLHNTIVSEVNTAVPSNLPCFPCYWILNQKKTVLLLLNTEFKKYFVNLLLNLSFKTTKRHLFLVWRQVILKYFLLKKSCYPPVDINNNKAEWKLDKKRKQTYKKEIYFFFFKLLFLDLKFQIANFYLNYCFISLCFPPILKYSVTNSI